MPASFQEILSSRLFTFVVGKRVDGIPTEFLVHEEAMAKLSTPLYSMMKKGYLESEAGRATWDDVSKETFERLAQFAYTGDYEVPKTEKRIRVVEEDDVLVFQGPALEAPPMEEPEFEEPTFDAPAPEEPAHYAPPMEEAPVDSWGTWGVPTKKDKKPRAQSKRQQAAKPKPKLADLADFHSLSFPLLAPQTIIKWYANLLSISIDTTATLECFSATLRYGR
ncbi:hypothetical protein V499_01116 [Pseudogymnoascus sp. VKM F-103]|nr:hypothetical protein V499_01116 [Pseudogymnoascus sp. VKM F-103]